MTIPRYPCNPLTPQVTSYNSITLPSKFRRLPVNVSGWVGLTVIIGLVSVQLSLNCQLELSLAIMWTQSTFPEDLFEVIQFLWYVTPIVRKKASVATLQSVAVRLSTGNVVVVTLTTVILSFLPPPFYFLLRNLWQGNWPDMSQTLSEKGMIQWYSFPDMSHTYSENLTR